MSMTDPIGDMLTRIRNAIHRKYETVDVPYSRLKLRVLEIMQREGFIRNFNEAQDARKHPVIRIGLRYIGEDRPVITDLQRVSRPGRRVYVKKDEMKAVRGGLGVAVISTSKGLMTDRDSRKQQLGGEVLCQIW